MWRILVLIGACTAVAGVTVIALGLFIYVTTLGNSLIVAGTVAGVGGLLAFALGELLRRADLIIALLEEERFAAPAHAAAPAPARLSPAPVTPVAPDFPPQRRAPEPPLPVAEEDMEQDEAEEPQEEILRRGPAQMPPPVPPLAPIPPLARLDRRDEPAPEPAPAAPNPAESRRPVRPERRPAEAEARPPRPPHPEAGPASAEPPAERETVRPTLRRPEAPEPTILKSGIVGGMAYTLYSDGSIQAELPDGEVRFASLQELRDHVAQAQTQAQPQT